MTRCWAQWDGSHSLTQAYVSRASILQRGWAGPPHLIVWRQRAQHCGQPLVRYQMVSNSVGQQWTLVGRMCVLCSSICRRNPYPSPCTPAKVAAHSCRIKQPYHIWSPQRSVLGPLLYIDGVTSTPLSDGSKMTCHCTDTLKHLRTIKSSKMT